MFPVVVVVICLLTGAVIVAVVCVHCRRDRFVLVPKVGTEYGGSSSGGGGGAGLKSTKRVVVMHSNVLYQPGGGGAAAAGRKDSDSMMPFLPVVKIETDATRLASQSTAFSEYEIPLDNDWEFPRRL